MKPWQSEELIWSCSSGAVSSGGVQNTVSRMVWPMPSGSAAGDQWLSPASRENETLLSGLRFDADVAAGERDIVELGVQLARGDPRQPFRDALGRELGGAGDGGREAAGVIARGDRPGVLGGVDFGVDPDVGRA